MKDTEIHVITQVERQLDKLTDSAARRRVLAYVVQKTDDAYRAKEQERYNQQCVAKEAYPTTPGHLGN